MIIRYYKIQKSAQDWIRTSTPFPALPPQGSASTNFATWAFAYISYFHFSTGHKTILFFQNNSKSCAFPRLRIFYRNTALMILLHNTP